MLHQLKKFAENPHVNLVVGLVLLGTAGREVVLAAEEVVGAHHGVAVFAVVQILKRLPHVVHELEGISKAGE